MSRFVNEFVDYRGDLVQIRGKGWERTPEEALTHARNSAAAEGRATAVLNAAAGKDAARQQLRVALGSKKGRSATTAVKSAATPRAVQDPITGRALRMFLAEADRRLRAARRRPR